MSPVQSVGVAMQMVSTLMAIRIASPAVTGTLALTPTSPLFTNRIVVSWN